MVRDEIIKNLTLDDIPKNRRDIAELIGIEAFLKLCMYSTGERLYFPKLESIIKSTRDKKSCGRL